jgi:hypothetical protein
MKKCLWLVLFGFSFGPMSLADEVTQKTDGSFVGDKAPKPINSLFIGDIANSMMDGSGMDRDVKKKTDKGFVGTDLMQENSFFAGDGFDQAQQKDTNVPFAQEYSKMEKDSAFIGQDIRKETDSAFSGESFGQ